MKMNKVISFTLATFLASGAIFFAANSQGKTVPWPEAMAELQKRNAAVKGFQVQFRLAVQGQFSPDKTGETDENELKTPNRAYSVFWATRDIMWRTEISELYPSDNQRDNILYFGGYNGEKFYSYDGRRELGIIASEEGRLRTGVELLLPYSAPDSNMLGLNYPLRYIQDLEKANITFRPAGSEAIDGINCMRYISKGQGVNGPYRITLWLAPEKGFAPMKIMDEEFISRGGEIVNGSIQLYIVRDFIRISDRIFLPKIAKKEYYAFPDGRRKLLSSITFIMHQFALSPNPTKDFFDEHFSPGTKVSNFIDNPGRLETVGGDYNDVISNAKSPKPMAELDEGKALPNNLN